MVTRRDLLRGMSLAAMAVAAPGLLAGCGESGRGEPKVPSDGSKLTLVSSDVARVAPDDADIAGGVDSVHAVAAGLYGELSPGEGNLALSPYSVVAALGMAVNGARGTTLDEMLTVCGSESIDSLNRGLNAMTQRVESLAGKVPHRKDAELLLDAANAQFGQRGYRWEPEFLDDLARYHGAGMQLVDYRTAATEAREVINQWTADQTHDLIDEIIPVGVLNDLTRLVLVNALYFKAPWADPFESTETVDGDFHLADGSTVQVPMMKGVRAASFATGDGWTAARLPYANETLAMTLVLPDEGRLTELEGVVQAGRLGELLPTAAPEQVDLTMPRWKFRTQAPLGTALASLGMPTAFIEGQADFSGMTTEEKLLISDVLHQVFIAVDEAGTEAAAATAVVFRASSAPVVKGTLVLDRPFLFVIHDTEHGTPLFLGRVADPSV